MIKLTSQNIYKELTAAPVNWLLANVADKIRIETIFSVQTYAISTLDNPFIVNQTDGRISANWIYDPQGQFTDFKIGDTIRLFDKANPGSTATCTIVDKSDDNSIQVSSNALLSSIGDDTPEDKWVISITDVITAAKYHWNFVENNNPDTFLSPIDASEQLLIHNDVDASDVTPLSMAFMGPLTYQEGSATIQGVSIDTGTTDGVYKSNFKIIHYTKVTPWILISQLENEINNIPHIDFEALKCWKFIYEIQAAYVYTDPNYIVSEIFSSQLGNSGWYNENFNTAKTNYTIDSVVYKNSDGDVIDSIGLSTDQTTVTVIIKNTTDTPFTPTETKFVLGFFKVPSVESEYLIDTQDSDENFAYDRALQTVGDPAVQGDQNGIPGRQVLQDIVGVYDSISQITITFVVNFGAKLLDALLASEAPRYLLFLSTQDPTLPTNQSDLVTLKIDMAEFHIENTDDEMIIISPTTFIRHPEADPDTEGVTPGPSGGNDADPVQWNITGITVGFGDVATMNLIISDGIGGNWVIGSVNGDDYSYDLEATMVALADSVNTNISNGDIIAYSFDNSFGFTAEWDVTNKILIVTPPAGSLDTYNGWQIVDDFQSGTFDGEAPEIRTFANGNPVTIIEFDCYPEDEIVAVTKFYIDRLNREADEIILTSVINRIVVKNISTLNSFELDGCTVNTAFYPKIGAVQYMDAQAARNFHLPAGTIRKYIELKRRIDLDGSSHYFYQMNFPLLFRWEYWAKLVGADSDFFDTALPNNGFNHWWFHYKSGDWKIYNRIIINATKNGVAQQYTLDTEMVPHDYNSNADWTVKTIKTYDSETNDELYDAGSGKRFILGYKDTLVKAVFTKNVTPANVTVIIGIEVWEQGGYYGNRIFSSRWAADSDTWFKSTDGSDKVVLTPSGDSIEAKCLIDFTQIPNAASFKLTARIYDGTFGLLTDDSVSITTDDVVFITVD